MWIIYRHLIGLLVDLLLNNIKIGCIQHLIKLVTVLMKLQYVPVPLVPHTHPILYYNVVNARIHNSYSISKLDNVNIAHKVEYSITRNIHAIIMLSVLQAVSSINKLSCASRYNLLIITAIVHLILLYGILRYVGVLNVILVHHTMM